MKKALLLLLLICPTLFCSNTMTQKTSFSGIQLGRSMGYVYASAHRGSRPDQEDVVAWGAPIQPFDQSYTPFGIAVFDGHGGSDIAEQLGGTAPRDDTSDEPLPNLVRYLLKDPHIARGDVSHDALIKAIKEKFVSYNKKLKNGMLAGGSCAVLALFLPEKIVIAHVGDSRAVSSDLISIMTHDHKPFLPDEKKRIEKAGGIVTKTKDGIYRVGGTLAVSRAFGDPKIVGITAEPDISIFDYDLKLLATSSSDLDTEFFPVSQFVKSLGLPEYTKNKIGKSTSGYRFIILASDGLWDNLPNHRIVDYFSLDFNFCFIATEDQNGLSEIDKTRADYQCSRLGTAEIATHIVESVLTKNGLNQKSLELAVDLLSVASIQKEKFKLDSFIKSTIVGKKSFFQKFKEFFVGPQDVRSIINKNLRKISDNQSIAIVAWDPKSGTKKLKSMSKKAIKKS
jgi:serine/threonine protein phosphatase PrpC